MVEEVLMATAENIWCELSVEEEIHGEWMFFQEFDTVLYFESNISLISLETAYPFNRLESSKIEQINSQQILGLNRYFIARFYPSSFSIPRNH